MKLHPEYRNRDLGTEIICMLMNQAFPHKNIFEVVSRAEHESDMGVNALQKADIVYTDINGVVHTLREV